MSGFFGRFHGSGKQQPDRQPSALQTEANASTCRHGSRVDQCSICRPKPKGRKR